MVYESGDLQSLRTSSGAVWLMVGDGNLEHVIRTGVPLFGGPHGSATA